MMYRTYNVHQNFILVDSGTLISAVVESHSQSDNYITYSYEYDTESYLKTEKVDKYIFNNYVSGDIFKIYVDKNKPNRTVVKDNKTALSLLSFGRSETGNSYIISVWIGYLIGFVFIVLGIFRFIKSYKKTPKSF